MPLRWAAEGATKPTSVYSVIRIEQSLVVVAHLTEGIPRYWLLDNSALETFASACRWPFQAKVLTDINGTSGIQTTWSILGPIIALIGIAIAFAGWRERKSSAHHEARRPGGGCPVCPGQFQ